MKQTIQRIAELQLQYSRDASAAMKERGKLIKKTLPKELQEVADFSNEQSKDYKFLISGRDGVGGHALIPFVKFSTKHNSKRKCKYDVSIFFSKNGEKVYVAIGTTTVSSRSEMKNEVQFARKLLFNDDQYYSSQFKDRINLGSKLGGVQLHEASTIAAQEFSVLNFNEGKFIGSIASALECMKILIDHLEEDSSPRKQIHEIGQDLSVAPNIFCMLMVHFFIQNRESMISDLLMDGNSNTYFPDDAKKYLEFKKVKVYGEDVESLEAEEIVPMIEELVGEIFPYFSFMSRIAPELSKFSKSILFPLDKPEQYVEAYRIGWLGFLSILDSENFDTDHYHCLASLLRHLADTGTEDLSEQSSYFINLIKSSMRGSAKNLLVDDSFPSNYFTSNKILDRTIKFLSRGSNSTVHDPACGLGGFLMKAFDRIYSKDKSKEFSINTITGADIDPMCVNLAKVFYMCKVFFTDTECMGLEEMINFLGEVAPNIVQQDSLSGKVGIFPESKNDFIYCNPPFDDLIEGSQESSYNHHGFIKIAEEFVEKGGQAVLLLPHSFLVSQRDHHCRMGLIKKYVIRRLYEYIFSVDENDRKIVLALDAPQSRRVNKLSVRSIENNKTIKKFEVSYSLLGESENYSLSIDELERNQIKKPSTEELSPSSLGELIDEKISKIEHDIDSIAKGMHQLRIYNKAQKSLSDGDCITCNLGSILSSIYTSHFDSQFENQPHCFFPFDERRRTFILQRHSSKSNHLEKKSRRLAGSGLIIYPDPSKLDPNYIDLWIRFSGIIGRYSIDMRGEERINPYIFSLAGGKERIIEDRFQKLKVKLHEQTIFLPPIPLQRDLVGILSNNSLLQYLIDQRKYSPVSRAKIPRQDLISLLFRFDGFT